MIPRRALWLILAGVFSSLGAQYPTTNFIVDAPTPEIAQQVGEYAEHYRKEKALQWLGHEMPPWGQRCPLKVSLTMNGSGGATTFAFDRGQILSQNMHIEGRLDRLLASVLPHEVTHTVFAYRFRTPVPRWADEGGAVLSEDEEERGRHDQLVRQILNTPGKSIRLRTLFTLRDYPREVMSLYAEGYSVSNYLVSISDRPTFLNFVDHGMRYGWDSAIQTHYAAYHNIEELEQGWLTHLRNTKKQPPAQLLARNAAPTEGSTTAQVNIRRTVPPVQLYDDSSRVIYRGKADEDGVARQAAGQRPGYLPDLPASPRIATPVQHEGQPYAAPRDPWGPPQVKLLPPQFTSPPSDPPAAVSPVGYPR
jgi:hypothetical protein